MADVKIEKADNGYIVMNTGMGHYTSVFHTLDEVFTYLLSHYESRAECFEGKYYGKVTVARGKDEPLSGGA